MTYRCYSRWSKFHEFAIGIWKQEAPPRTVEQHCRNYDLESPLYVETLSSSYAPYRLISFSIMHALAYQNLHYQESKQDLIHQEAAQYLSSSQPRCIT
ncbi:hypothetical protein MtrunA17_Chr7g0217541 [Medicago truncatula]|uniref:Uncharacterized protein n=1 Tax=Medicago truncatula TaxID=3880 RepID=A0A072TXM3_MEDTR|nr:hypothetical protein MTR_7g010905 [Medicago truncatula]RHN44267.1 hypothetical protein MtrunA17_Chr7g0217541 [Medicago truncatula]